jgi:hypothetical protein
VPPRWQPYLEDYIDIAAYLLGADRAAIATLPRTGHDPRTFRGLVDLICAVETIQDSSSHAR